jgi:hypothetical protein
MGNDESLKLFRPIGQRASKLKKRALSVLEATSENGLPASMSSHNGFLIRNSIIDDDLHRSIVIPPDGRITVFSSYYGYKIYEQDNYNGIIDKTSDAFGADFLIKKYVTTGTGYNSIFACLIHGQKEEKILETFPYYNTVKYRFVRNGSYFNLNPDSSFNQNSYQFPDSWPTPLLFHSYQENFYSVFSGTDLIWNNYLYPSSEIEISKLNFTGNGKQIGGRISFFEQSLAGPSSPKMSFMFPVTSGFFCVYPATGMYYPFFEGRRYYATIAKEVDGLFSYDKIFLDEIIHDSDNIPASHTGAVMPSELRNILLTDENSSVRPHTFWSFSTEPDRLPVIVNVIDFSGSDNYFNTNGDDIYWFRDNENYRNWRISIHFNDLQTGNTWSFTADQFWGLLRQKLINLEMGDSWAAEDVVNVFTKGSWYAAGSMLRQLFARPNHSFNVPHDTVTFNNPSGDVFSWTRYYGSFRIARDGIFEEDIQMPSCSDYEGIRPSIYFSHIQEDEIGTKEVYVCICERLERINEAESDSPEGPKKVVSCWIGNPFDGIWEKLQDFEKEAEGHTWTIAAAKPVIHNQKKQPLLLAVARNRYLEDGVEVIKFYSAEFNGKWKIGQQFQNLNVKDPVYGERWSVDMCLFGGKLSKQAVKYPTNSTGSSQYPCGPYDGYLSGLP